MDRHYSTLELVRRDEIARAPERDYDATAFELDGAPLAPQAIPDETPEVFYDSSLTEAQGHQESTKKGISSLHITKPVLKWPWIVIALLIAVVVAVGVAFGIWSHRDYSSHNSSTVTSPPVAQNHSTIPTSQFILNDTSLAAVSDTRGNRYLFFQDTTGLLRGMKYNSNSDQWSASLNMGTNSSAKNYTPLAATQYGLEVTVYYVSERYILNSSTLVEGFWRPDIQPADLSSGNFSTAAETRSLSIVRTMIELPSTPVPKPNVPLDSLYRSLLYYEDPTGRISVLSQQFLVSETNRSLTETPPAEWVNVTSQESKSLPDEFRNTPASASVVGGHNSSKTLYESLGSNTTIRAPFTSGANWSGFCVGAIFYSPQFYLPNASELQFTIEGYNMSLVGNFTSKGPFLNNSDEVFSGQNPVQDFSSINQSDIALFDTGNAIWINHTQPTILGPNAGLTPPNNTFPFSRLASITSNDSLSYSYLYHQINGTTFAEEQWDSSMQTWTTYYITASY